MNTQILNRTLLIILFASAIVFGTQISAQSSELNYSIEIVDASSGGANDGSITIQIKAGQPGFYFVLRDKDSKNKSKPIAYTEKLSDYQYTFHALKAGTYFICVVDSEDSSRCQKAEVKTK